MIYVDDLFFCPAHGHNEWCHMTADTLSELHYFAARIGLKRAWFQSDIPEVPGGKHASIPHYDLTPGKRALAIRKGAKEIGTLEMCKIWRKNGKRIR